MEKEGGFMAERTVPQYARDQEAPAKEETRSQDAYVTPPVDIYETADGLVVKADLPGVTKDGLDLRVENNLLTIRGRAAHCAPGNLLYREYNLQNFFRQFELSDRVDQGKISAELQHGVLTLNLPKAEEAKPRKIDVRVM
jgi:HSP20 family molecular chaperone IbpA